VSVSALDAGSKYGADRLRNSSPALAIPATTLVGLVQSSHRSVDYISFSAHVDYTQNAKFIDEVSS
jgi:hypothetical protein